MTQLHKLNYIKCSILFENGDQNTAESLENVFRFIIQFECFCRE